MREVKPPELGGEFVARLVGGLMGLEAGHVGSGIAAQAAAAAEQDGADGKHGVALAEIIIHRQSP